ncbi:hypothetical protein N656DRAFT_780035 [Canariomyces notabilis]|uniref:Uncharacterized protein n=1 Tax=Canariomyces notabilis TaxID=2074819 RepID=A0AAN6TCK4_9PEZI|nr:hypothetical protein N656DRAFT_780035 [Canariomyces arenarius]
MKVDVDGRLEKWDKHIMSKVRFGDMGNKARDSQAVTLVDFANSLKSERRLDEIARGLPLAMQMKNFEEVAPVFPRPVTNTTFHIASHPTSTANEDQATITAAPVAGSTQRPVPAVSQPLQDYSTFNEHLLPENPTQQKQPSWVHQDTDNEPTIQNLARIMRDLSDPEPIYGQPHHRAPPASVDDADTVVGSNDGREDTGTQTVPKQGVATQAMVLNDTDPQALVKILQIPAVLSMLRMLITLMNLIGYVPAASDVDKKHRGSSYIVVFKLQVELAPKGW